jgi:hypothetical protein
MTRLFAVLSSVVLFTGANATRALPSESLQGVWQTVEVTVTGPGARTIVIPEPRPNLIILTPKYYSRVEIHAEGPRPALTDMTKASADELRAIWGPVAAEAGTYTAAGNVLTMQPLAAKNPAAMAPGAFVTYTYKLDGNTLLVTYQKDQNGPIVNPVTVKAVRIE